MKNLFSFFLACVFTLNGWAVEMIYDNHTYESHIQTVRLYASGIENAYPILYLGESDFLTLEFDELLPQSENASNFTASLILCDADWQPSNLMPMEFYEGFTTQSLDEYTRTENTNVPYIHYSYSFPKEETGFKMSGNYILYIYRNGDKENLVLTRRFMVADKQMEVNPTLTLAGNAVRMRQTDVNFTVDNKGNLPISNQDWDIKVVVLQNGRWDNAATNLKPVFFRNNVWEYHLNINNIFNTGNDFRRMDISSTRLFGMNVENSQQQDDNTWAITLKKDVAFPTNMYRANGDWNGGYITRVNEFPDPKTQADYVNCHFTFKPAEFFDDLDLYVQGHFNDFHTSDTYKLAYNESLRVYEKDIWLKQGIYDYQYVLQNPITQQKIEVLTEGKRTDSENFYHVLVYYKRITDRTHQLVACRGFNM